MRAEGVIYLGAARGHTSPWMSSTRPVLETSGPRGYVQRGSRWWDSREDRKGTPHQRAGVGWEAL